MEEQALFELLSHPIRRNILKQLARHYLLTYSDLKEILHQNPGVIYHHLEKIRKLGLIQQRQETKEYELTPRGWIIVENMEVFLRNQERTEASRGHVARFFMNGILVDYLKRSPHRSLVELVVILIASLMLLRDVPVLVIGPFLIPTRVPLIPRIGFSISSFVILLSVIVFLSRILRSRADDSINTIGDLFSRELPFLSGLLLFPLISYLLLLLAWSLSFVISPIPEWLYWMLTVILHLSYVIIALFLFIGVKGLTLERSVVIIVIFQYSSLLLVFLLVTGAII